MIGVILAAGTSRRLGMGTHEVPKCLLQVGGKSMLSRQLDQMNDNGIKRVYIAVGFHKDKVIHYCQVNHPLMDIKFVPNNYWYESNNATSLGLVINKMVVNKDKEDIFLANADVVCYDDLVKELIFSEVGENRLAYQRKPEYPEEDMKVVLLANERLMAIGKKLEGIDPQSYDGEFTGMAVFSGASLNILLKYLERCEENSWFERALQLWLAEDERAPLFGIDVSHYPSIEIDFPEDLDRANEYFPYDQPVWEQGQRHGSEFNQERAFGLLKDITELLEKNGVESYLNWGCLLGVYRDNQFIPWDTDIDITCFWEDRDKVLSLIPEMQKLRCFIPPVEKCYPEDFWIIRDGEKIELNFVESIDDKYIYSPDRSKLAAPKNYIKPFRHHNFRGKMFNIPNETEKYLTASYGNTWRTPIKGKKPVSL